MDIMNELLGLTFDVEERKDIDVPEPKPENGLPHLPPRSVSPFELDVAPTMSSAAAPVPPPHLVPVSNSTGDGYSPSRASMSGNNRSSASTSRPGSSNGGSSGSSRPWPHIKDLRNAAEENPNSKTRTFASLSNTQLLFLLENALRNFGASRGVGRLDHALTEFLRANYIASVAIDRDTLRGDNQAKYRRFVTEISNLERPYDEIRRIIELDNARNGTISRSSVPTQPEDLSPKSRPLSIPPSLVPNGLAAPPTTNGTISHGQAKVKPPVSPKPQNLHGASSSAGNRREAVMLPSDDPLAQRFANLRASDVSSEAAASAHSEYRQSLATNGQSETSGTEYSSRDPRQSLPNGYGPRSRVSVNTNMSKELPKPPSPTYTPTSSVHRSSAMQPPRSSRSTAHERRSSVASTSSVTSQSQLSDSGRRLMAKRRKTVVVPSENEIETLRLYDYMQKYNILIIDVRSREEFDRGHIWASSSICVEPTALRQDMSAEELQESLVLAPEDEQALFSQRDKFDVIVYYDQSTANAVYLDNHAPNFNPALRYLHNALYIFNQEKPLRRPPVLLMGGLDAWIDMQGKYGLKTSDTAHRPRVARPISRRPIVNGDSRLSLQKRRHRDFNPIDEDEERKWRERARSESVVLDQVPMDDGSESGGTLDPEAVRRQAEDFARRYPDVMAVEQASTAAHQPRRDAPPPPRIPTYPTAPVSAYQNQPVPQVPSRPPPAVARPSYSGVSERIASPSTQAPLTQQLSPYIPPKLKRLPRVGLHNFGVTCYMNATLQCLSATIPLTALFLDMQWKKWVQTENWKGTRGVMAEYYWVLLRNLWQSNDVDTIRPTNFRKFCARLNQEWGVDRQQDAKEFLEFIVDMLHEDLNANWHRNPLQPLTPEAEAQREKTPELVASKFEWSRYEHRDLSPLTQLFAGQHVSRLQCTTCHNTSTTYEPFYSISVEIPSSPRNHPVSVYDCLRSYCSAETLAGDEVWRCPHCRTSREATKRITITRAPDFLVLHFKRFSASHSEKARKIHTPVDFPLEGLDLEPFMLPSLTPQQQAKYASRYKDLEVPHQMQPPYRYDAYAVMRHLGSTMTSGHYISLVKDKARGLWREFNDERVGDFKPEELKRGRELQNGEAYIVFYQRVRD
ncbi:MAG: ubiquitin-specific protease doa4 [Chrysothrix sp. TS-e1954]|nr:MAG: ubiquitin-specific protease doa4 [Chrysothrix sp. TS-e1954]